MVGENTSLEGGLMAALVLFIANFILKKTMFLHAPFRKMVQGSSQILVKDGIADFKKMDEQSISLEELEESIREHGVEHLSSVKLAILEVDGNISIISSDRNNQTHYTKHKRKLSRKRYKF